MQKEDDKAASWHPTAEIKIIKQRAALLADIRQFFQQRAVLEVETPVLSPYAPTAPYLESFSTTFTPLAMGDNRTLYLHTSPEFMMKRLLAAGSGPIYQMGKVFRNGEKGQCHAPEFTLLEWYHPGYQLQQLIDEVIALLTTISDCGPVIQYRYDDIFRHYIGLDIFSCSDEALRQAALTQITAIDETLTLDRDGWCEIIMSYLIEPQLAQHNGPVVVYDFPASQAQLAKLTQNAAGQTVAARFEVYMAGLELANGYDELCDAVELKRRFDHDNQQRQRQNKDLMPIDQSLLAAMQAGLPQCAGVALGIDRLCMALFKQKDMASVQSFSEI